MPIHWRDVRPHTLPDAALHGSDLWLHELSFEQGKRYAFSAISGKGKSTAVSILSLSRTDYDGSLAVNGIDTKTAAATELARLKREVISTVWQDLRLIPHLTGQENVLLRQTQVPDAATWSAVESWAVRLKIDQVWHRPASKLSYGERQRVAIIRALVLPFQFLILDEPFSHLDPGNTSLAGELIQDVCTGHEASYIITTLQPEPELPTDILIRL